MENASVSVFSINSVPEEVKNPLRASSFAIKKPNAILLIMYYFITAKFQSKIIMSLKRQYTTYFRHLGGGIPPARGAVSLGRIDDRVERPEWSGNDRPGPHGRSAFVMHRGSQIWTAKYLCIEIYIFHEFLITRMILLTNYYIYCRLLSIVDHY